MKIPLLARRQSLWVGIRNISYALFALLFLVGCQPLLVGPESSPSIGQLAYIGEDGNVYVAIYSATGEQLDQQQITSDATTYVEGIGRSYHRLSWSQSGHLAFAAVDRTSTSQRGQLYIVSPQTFASEAATSGAVSFGPPLEIVHSTENPFIYISWSPQSCDVDQQCLRLAYLITEGKEVALHAVDIHNIENESTIQNTTIDLGRPFYLSWAPNGEKILGHIGGARRYIPEAKIVLYDLKQNLRSERMDAPGPFLAPAWSPHKLQWLNVVDLDATQEDSQLQLQISDLGGQQTIANVQTGTEFVWSPDGKKVAFATRNPRGPYFHPIQIYDVEMGMITELTDLSLNVRAFFWSPDGKRIAYLHWLSSTVSSLMQWRAIDVATGQDRGFPAFNAAFGMNFMIGSFNQYAQSHRFWSPDGRFLVYVDMDLARTERIWLVDTLAPRNTKPILVGEGALGVWSWR